ncbi:MAG: alpha/beta hydrolase [Aureispira sp.]
MKYISILLLFLSGFNKTTVKETFEIPSKDGINLKADFYKADNESKPLILLFHQAGYSRGEYLEIGPKLNELGFSCLAIDQRSGDKINGVINESSKQAKKKKLKTQYVNALPDLEATLAYVKGHNYAPNGVILLGSSYSAALIFILGAQQADEVKGLIAFSPGEYFKYKDQPIAAYAKDVNVPVFITSAKNEKKYWEAIYKPIKTEKKYFLPASNGYHGAKALWEKNKGNEQYWGALEAFLNQY